MRVRDLLAPLRGMLLGLAIGMFGWLCIAVALVLVFSL